MRVPTNLSGLELRKALERAGFVFQRQRGRHMILRRFDPLAKVVIPAHPQIRPGTLRQIVHEAGLTVEQLKALL